MKPCVFFDRDGVVNTAPPPEMYYVTRVDDFHLEPGFVEALRVVRARGYEAVIVTNQKCVARGLLTPEGLEHIHAHLRELLAAQGLCLTDIVTCPHGDDECDCRKPKPGMLLAAAQRHALDLSRSWMVGDSERDIEAGRAAGCRTVLIAPPDRRTTADHQVTSVDELSSFLDSHLT